MPEVTIVSVIGVRWLPLQQTLSGTGVSHPCSHVVSTMNTLTLLYYFQEIGDIKQNVQATLFHALKVDSNLCCEAFKSMWLIVTGGNKSQNCSVVQKYAVIY